MGNADSHRTTGIYGGPVLFGVGRCGAGVWRADPEFTRAGDGRENRDSDGGGVGGFLLPSGSPRACIFWFHKHTKLGRYPWTFHGGLTMGQWKIVSYSTGKHRT